MNKKLILMIVILAGIIAVFAGVAWYLGNYGEIAPGLTPSGSFSVAYFDNGRTINLTYEKNTEVPIMKIAGY